MKIVRGKATAAAAAAQRTTQTEMSNLAYINPGGKQARKASALDINMIAARGLQEVLKTNLGPRGTMKMLVSGAGAIKITLCW